VTFENITFFGCSASPSMSSTLTECIVMFGVVCSLMFIDFFLQSSPTIHRPSSAIVSFRATRIVPVVGPSLSLSVHILNLSTIFHSNRLQVSFG
jgi:hypothetical protein